MSLQHCAWNTTRHHVIRWACLRVTAHLSDLRTCHTWQPCVRATASIRATETPVSPCHLATLPSNGHLLIFPYYRATVPTSHRVIVSHCHRSTEWPRHYIYMQASNCTTVPPCHLPHTPTVPPYHLAAAQGAHIDTISPYIQFLKIAMTHFMGFNKLFHYIAQFLSRIKNNPLQRGMWVCGIWLILSCFWTLCCLTTSILWIVWPHQILFLNLRTINISRKSSLDLGSLDYFKPMKINYIGGTQENPLSSL